MEAKRILVITGEKKTKKSRVPGIAWRNRMLSIRKGGVSRDYLRTRGGKTRKRDLRKMAA